MTRTLRNKVLEDQHCTVAFVQLDICSASDRRQNQPHLLIYVSSSTGHLSVALQSSRLTGTGPIDRLLCLDRPFNITLLFSHLLSYSSWQPGRSVPTAEDQQQ